MNMGQAKVDVKGSRIVYNVTCHSTTLLKHIYHLYVPFTFILKGFLLGSLSFLPPTDNHEWDIPEWEGLDSRYEHCSFVPESCPQSLWVFGGAQQSGNRNCIQNLQLTGKSEFKSP